MADDRSKCPWCGAKGMRPSPRRGVLQWWYDCGSWWDDGQPNPGQGEDCIRSQLAAVTAHRDRLLAACQQVSANAIPFPNKGLWVWRVSDKGMRILRDAMEGGAV